MRAANTSITSACTPSSPPTGGESRRCLTLTTDLNPALDITRIKLEAPCGIPERAKKSASIFRRRPGVRHVAHYWNRNHSAKVRSDRTLHNRHVHNRANPHHPSYCKLPLNMLTSLVRQFNHLTKQRFMCPVQYCLPEPKMPHRPASMRK